MAHVIVMHGRDVIQKIKLEKVENLIGRSLGAEIPLDNVLVSRRHAMLAKERGIWIVRELSGKNGIYVNGERVRKHALRDGDQIGVGKYTIRFWFHGMKSSAIWPLPTANPERTLRCLPVICLGAKPTRKRSSVLCKK